MSTLVDFIRANWHEVPSEATIPDDMEFAVIWPGGHKVTHYAPGETGTHFRVACFTLARFTPEPLPEPARIVPNGIGVMDETDKRDRLDVEGVRWKWSTRTDTWVTGIWVTQKFTFGTLAALNTEFGPLRFAEGGDAA